MTEIRYAPEFERHYRELPLAVQRKAERRERLFRPFRWRRKAPPKRFAPTNPLRSAR